MLLKQTKIVATISDKRCDVDFIKGLFEAGMNVVRMNTAHLGREGSEMLINNVRAVSNRIAILMDTKGPEVRTTICADPIAYKVGDRVKVVGDPDLETTVSVFPFPTLTLCTMLPLAYTSLLMMVIWK